MEYAVDGYNVLDVEDLPAGWMQGQPQKKWCGEEVATRLSN